jgi:hypothetical protein
MLEGYVYLTGQYNRLKVVNFDVNDGIMVGE